jgi:hypothetical protein
MKRRIKFIVVLMVLFFQKAAAQTQLSHLIPSHQLKINFVTGNVLNFSEHLVTRLDPLERASTPSYKVPGTIQPDFYTRNFGFFCDKELRLEKSTKIPLKFRLGSLDYCNKLEGK